MDNNNNYDHKTERRIPALPSMLALTLTEAECYLQIAALDLYSRIWIGQYDQIDDIYIYEIDSRCPKIYLSEVGCKAKSGVENTGNNLGLSDQTSPIKGTIRSTGGFRMKQTYWKKVLESEDFIDSKYYTLF